MYVVYTVEFPKTDTPRSGQLRIPNNGQGTGAEWCVLMPTIISQERTTSNMSPLSLKSFNNSFILSM